MGPGKAPAAEAQRAAAMLELACARGHDPACVQLAEMLDLGEGIPEEPDRARSLWQRACEHGDPAACSAAGRALRSDGNFEAAEAAWQRGCKLGGHAACSDLGVFLLATARDEARAIELLVAACAHDVGAACKKLGELHETGRGMPKDRGAALRMYDRACALGVDLSCVYAKRLRGG